jgi:hypothetical protein
MSGRTKRNAIMLAVLLMLVVTAPAQTRREREVLSIQGSPGEAAVIQFQNRMYVDVQDLARITNSSLRFDGERIILALPVGQPSELAGDTDRQSFSRPFMRAAIEAMASVREWGGMMLITIQNGYPVGNTMAGNTIMAYQGRAADSVALAAAASSTDSDRRGLELLSNELNNAQSWADRFIKARSSLSAANLSMSEHALADDEEFQKLLHCGQFLAQMFASGTFQDNASCH